MLFQIDDETFDFDELVTAARHIAWHYSIGNPAYFHAPGDMMQEVMRAMARADHANMRRLARAYPLYGMFFDDLKFGVRDTQDRCTEMISHLISYGRKTTDADHD